MEGISRPAPALALSFAAGLAAAAIYGALQSTFTSNKAFASPSPITPSPLAQHGQDKSLAYPAHGLLPGARDVSSPYGNIRVYEFGPEDATRRVVLLHGISTPSIALIPLARILAANGARVILVDLFGRGWSGAPADDIPHDGRLYASLVLTAITSSPMPWTGNGRHISLIGYSLGGGLVTDFTYWHPELVEDVVAIAPAGLLRDVHIGWRSLALYYARGFFPESWSENAVANMLRSPPKDDAKPAQTSAGKDDTANTTPNIAPKSETPADAVITMDGRSIDLAAAVDWQVDNHPGFLRAFVSCIRGCPIQRQHARWAEIGKRARARKQTFAPLALTSGPENVSAVAKATEQSDTSMRRGLRSGRILVIMGSEDRIVRAEEVEPDALKTVGPGEVCVKVVQGAGHEVPITHAQEVARYIMDEWQMS